MTRLAIFDFDRCITTSGSFTPFLWRIVKRHPLRVIGVPVILAAAIGYKLKLVDRRGLKQIMLKLMVRGLLGAEVEHVVREFCTAWMSHCRPGALACIAAHRTAGDVLVMATASNDLYMATLARELGFHHLVATATERTPDGGVTGHIPGTNCYGADKLTMIHAALRDIPDLPTESISYSDHHTDEPMLAWTTQGVAVNPNRKLRQIAAERGFAIVDWGKPG